MGPCFVMLKSPPWARAGTGRDFVPGCVSPYLPGVPNTIVLWTCSQEDNSLKFNLMSMASLSLAIVSENLGITG